MSASDKLADILRAIQGSVLEVKTSIAVNRMGTMTEVEDGAGRVLIDGMDDDTPCSLMVNANVGDRVTVEIVGNAAKVTGNYTAPPTDDTVADEAEGEAKRAHEAADAARQEASRANEAADAAQESADEAAGAASDAKASATRANAHANDALAQLSVVQDVAGTLSWIAEHGTYRASTDAAVVDGTVYFELVDGEYVPVAEPEGSPAEHGWYVLDVTDSQTDYIMAHLAVTSRGLWVLPSGIGQASDAQHAAGYKALIAATGMTVYDGDGTAVVTYGSSTTFATDRDWMVGNQQAYVFYDASENTLQIGGANVTIGGKAPADLLTSIDVSATQTATGADITVNGTTVSLTNGAQGPQGPQGQTGATGPQGPQGPQGSTGPEAVVTIAPTAIDWTNGNATLQATLRVNGAITTSGVTYKWTKGTSTTSLGTSRTLSVTDLNATYNCTCTW